MSLSASIKRALFRKLSLRNYLRTVQGSYFLMYDLGLLRRNPDYKYHHFVKELIRPGDHVIDIGANLGYFSYLFSRRCGPSGRVLSVEPIEVYVDLLRAKCKNCRNLEILPYALGDEDKEIKLVTSPGTGYLHTGLPHVYDPSRDGELSAQEFTFEARMKRPEDLFGELGRVDYIKCDVEGFEYPILVRMKDIIVRHRPVIQLEVWDANREKTLGLFDGMGYIPYILLDGSLFPLKADTPSYGDILFVHSGDDRYNHLKA